MPPKNDTQNKNVQNAYDEISAVIKDLERALKQYGTARSSQGDLELIDMLSENITAKIHHLDDLGESCDMPLLAYLAQSLHSFMAKFSPDQAAHKVILRAHIDAMQYVYNYNIHDEDHTNHNDLKALLETAITKHAI